MATASKKAADTAEAEAETVTWGPAPDHAAALCGDCGVHPLDPSTTAYSCEHGSWTFQPAGAAPVDPADKARAALAAMDPETRAALLAELAAAAPQA